MEQESNDVFKINQIACYACFWKWISISDSI